jgi:dihydrofolate synthase/folylpolyglutamate synthase
MRAPIRRYTGKKQEAFVARLYSPLDFLNQLGVSRWRLGLERMHTLLALLGQPQNQIPVIHVAGTNGKGSVVAMLTYVLRAAGYRVGSTISPHLVHVGERIQINATALSPAAFEAAVADLQNCIQTHLPHPEAWPSYFECLIALAFSEFAKAKVDVAVIETGLGGRLDATNVVARPLATIITSISYDHMELLGHTLAEIAGEKAGIFRPHTPVILGPVLPPEAETVLRARAEALCAPVFHAAMHRLERATQLDARENTASPLLQQVFRDTHTGAILTCPLLGPYQAHNVATVLTTLAQVKDALPVTAEALAQGLAETVWPGRFQYLPSRRLLVDGSHNAEGLARLATDIPLCFPGKRLHWLLTLKSNRDPACLLAPVLALKAQTASLTWTQHPERQGYHPPEILRAHALAAGLFPEAMAAAPDFEAACTAWQRQVEDDPPGLGVMTGSLYTAGAFLGLLSPQE